MQKANAVRTGLAVLTAVVCPCLGETLTVVEEPELIKVVKEDRSILVYQRTPNEFKTYISELRTPAGLQLLLDSPSDHIHHHALMFAVNADGREFWSEHPGNGGQQIPKSTRVSTASDRTGAVIDQTLDWVDHEKTHRLVEDRTITIQGATEGATLLTWRSQLRPAVGRDSVGLTGAHYFGLGMRFIREFDNKVTFVHPKDTVGKVYRGSERLTPGRWCAAQGTVDGKPVTAAMFDHPLNPRYPATWFTMSKPFGYLSATPNLEQQPRTILAGQTFDLRYGVALLDGHVGADAIERLYAKWLSLEQPLGERVNIALAKHGTKATASSVHGPDYTASKAIDGKYSVRETDKWNSAAKNTPHYLKLDLGRSRTIDTIVVRHEGVLPLLDAHKFNSADFRLQHSSKPNGPFADLVAPIRDNTDNVTLHRFKPVQTRYLRLLIETAEQKGNSHGRIAEMEVWVSSAR